MNAPDRLAPTHTYTHAHAHALPTQPTPTTYLPTYSNKQAFCYVLAACACLNSCNLGYDVGSVGGAALLMKEEFGWTYWEEGFYIGCVRGCCGRVGLVGRGA